jgi:hypothetical protein
MINQVTTDTFDPFAVSRKTPTQRTCRKDMQESTPPPFSEEENMQVPPNHPV